MSTADVLGLASLVVAFVALSVSALAIRRDRAYLIVREADAAAGSRYLTIANVGMRPVRITHIVMRRHRWRPWEATFDLGEYSGIYDAVLGTLPLPVVLQPADEVVLRAANPEMLGLPYGTFAVLDASGRFHWPRARTKRLEMPPKG
jgi:hypothetical protein